MKKPAPIGEILLYIGIFIVGFSILSSLDAFEWLHEYSRTHEELELDEFLLSVPVLLLCLAVFSFRRSRELRLKNAELEKTHAKLTAAHDHMKEMAQSKQRFMNVACHELKAPLSRATSTLTLAQQSEDEDEISKLVGLAHDDLERLQLLVGDVIRLANLADDLKTVQDAPFSVRDTLESVARIAGDPARDKGLTFSLMVDEDVPARLVGNEGWIRLICLKLATNAVTFTTRGEVTLHCGFTASPDTVLRIIVSDTGTGIPENMLGKIFEAYKQGGPSARRHQGGLGLGLFTARELAGRMGGSISVNSTVGTGSTFTVTLPVELP